MGAVYSYLFGESPFDASWPAYEEKMRAEGLSNAAIAAFKYNFKMLTSGACLLPTHCCCCTTSPSLLLSPHLSPGSPLALLSLSLSLRLFAKLSLRPLSRLSRSLQLRSFPRTLALPGANLMIPGESIQPVESLPDYASLTTEVPTPPTDARPAAPHTLSPWWL